MVKRNIKWLLVVLVLGLCPSILHAEDPYGEMKALADSAQKVLGQDRLPSINARWIKLARVAVLYGRRTKELSLPECRGEK